MRSTLCLVLLAAACGDNVRPEPPDGMPPDPPEMIEREHAGGLPSAVVLAGDRIYLGIGPRLVIRSATAQLGESAALRGNVGALAVVGDRAFVAERLDLDAKLHVFDVSDPAAIVETKVLDLAQPNGTSVINGLSVGPDRLYVADQEQGVIELDITDPDAPVVVTTAQVFGVTGTKLSGTRLYYFATGFIGGLTVGALDTTNNLADLGSAGLDGAGLAFADGDLVVTAGPNGIFVHSLATIDTPVEKFHHGMTDAGPFARAIATAGTTAWVPANEGLFTLDLSNPDDVQLTGPVAMPTVGANAAAATGTTLVTVTDRGRLVRVEGAASPSVVDITLCADCVDVDVTDGTLFVADIVGGLRSARLANLAALGRSPAPDVTPGPDGLQFVFEGVAHEGTLAFAGDWYFGLRIYDATDPAALVEVGALQTGGAPSDVTVVGDRAYVPEGTNGGALHVVDISNPAAPVALGSIPTSKALEVEVRDNLAYVADESLFDAGGLKIFDVTDAAKIEPLGVYNENCEFANDVALLGDLAIVSCSFDGFHIVDISNPMLPTRVAVIPPPEIASAHSVAAYEGHAVLGHDRGVAVVSLADPANPVEIAAKPTAFAVRSIAIREPGWIVGAAGPAGIYQWQIE